MKKRAHSKKSASHKSSHRKAAVPKTAKRHIDAIGKHCDALKKIAHKKK